VTERVPDGRRGQAPGTQPTQGRGTVTDPASASSPSTESTEPRESTQQTRSTGATQPAQATGAPGKDPHAISRTRTSSMWTAVACAAVVLLVLLIFILQNQQPVTVAFFGLQGRLPLGVALLLAAVGGALVVLVAGMARILQLRRVARRHRKQDRRAAPATGGERGTAAR